MGSDDQRNLILVGHPDFGRHIDPSVILQSVLSVKAVKSNLEAKQLLAGIYETIYGIFDHVKNSRPSTPNKRPLASVAFHPGEDFTSTSLLEDTMKTFRDYPIGDIFKCDYFQFMAQTSDIAELMIKVAKDHREKEAAVANRADAAIKSAMKDNNPLDKKKQAEQLDALRRR